MLVQTGVQTRAVTTVPANCSSTPGDAAVVTAGKELAARSPWNWNVRTTWMKTRVGSWKQFQLHQRQLSLSMAKNKC